MRVSSSTSSSVKPLRQPGTIISMVVPGWSATAAASRSSSASVAARDGTGWPSPSLWVGARDVERPIAPSARAECSAASMPGQLLVGGFVADGVVAHHRPPEGGVADQKAGVDPDVPVEPGQPLTEGSPRPVQPGLEGGEGHALHPGQHP